MFINTATRREVMEAHRRIVTRHNHRYLRAAYLARQQEIKRAASQRRAA